MNVEAELKQKRLSTTKRHFGYESPYEPIQDALRKIETAFLNVIVDTTIFQLDIDGTTLTKEIEYFPSTTIKQHDYHINLCLHPCKQAHRNLHKQIIATLPITAAAAERSFSNLMLIKTNLRSTIPQDCLSGLAIISINNELSYQLPYDAIIDDFVAKKTCRVGL
nr:uncharacterized protein LOC121132107 [Lepeophtheirus salmonis]